MMTVIHDLLFFCWMAVVLGSMFWYITMWPILGGIVLAFYRKKVHYAVIGLLVSYFGSLAGMIILLVCCFRISIL